MFKDLSIEELECKIEETRASLNKLPKGRIYPLTTKLVELEDLRFKKLWEEGKYEEDLSTYETIESVTALNSEGEVVIFPLDGVVDVDPNGKLWVSDFDYGTLSWDEELKSYIREYDNYKKLIDIVGFVDVVEVKDKYVK
jgi:hypothetical protein